MVVFIHWAWLFVAKPKSMTKDGGMCIYTWSVRHFNRCDAVKTIKYSEILRNSELK